jgi:hypothetical protein
MLLTYLDSKLANYQVNLAGRLPLPGASANDLLNLSDNWMKSIALERL